MLGLVIRTALGKVRSGIGKTTYLDHFYVLPYSRNLHLPRRFLLHPHVKHLHSTTGVLHEHGLATVPRWWTVIAAAAGEMPFSGTELEREN